MILYLDTSALVKLYVAELGSDDVKAKVEAAPVIAVSRVAYVEARAGLARKFREGEISREEYRRVVKDLDSARGTRQQGFGTRFPSKSDKATPVKLDALRLL